MLGKENAKIRADSLVAFRLSHAFPQTIHCKRLTDEVLRELSGVFDCLYSRIGGPSIPPERLLKTQVLIALYHC